MKRSDTDIRRDVEAELQWDPSIDDRNVGVIVSDGVVTLTGEVTHLTGRWAAEDIAKRGCGVRAIANEIQVKLPLSGIRSDTEIAEAAANALRWNVATATSPITPIVNNGCVTLSGKVMWGFQKHAAERSVRVLLGVQHVTNDITVASRIKVPDVKQHIEEALKRLALHEAKQIHVQVEDSTITLSGQVHSWQEQSDAIAAAWMIPGVGHVVNRLQVR
jgi:osmotically-inducible protein OsmY